MEGKKQTGSSSSSFTSDLFGSKDNSPSSMGIFGSIFAPASPKVLIIARRIKFCLSFSFSCSYDKSHWIFLMGLSHS